MKNKIKRRFTLIDLDDWFKMVATNTYTGALVLVVDTIGMIVFNSANLRTETTIAAISGGIITGWVVALWMTYAKILVQYEDDLEEERFMNEDREQPYDDEIEDENS